ncbi:MAG: sulfotransferase [Candidatus Heimdallarchaeota archaeon]|nr:sulfotransferase [Candidatus Heimdallarchaeota archaeon]
MGTSFGKWFKLLWKNSFKVGFKHILKALAITILTFFFSPLILLEKLLFQKKIKKVSINRPPVFIIGHWRSGTTHLHNMLSKDESFVYPTIIEAIFPSIFLASRGIISFLVNIFLPKTRPQDKVKMNLSLPQEHEYALAALSLYSPFIGLLFPNNRDSYLKYCSFEGVSKEEQKEWESIFLYYLKKLLWKKKTKQLLLKSPIDTYRIKILLKLFPNAKFIHIYRNPYEVFFSSKNLYRKNGKIVFLQTPKDSLDSFIFKMYVTMYDQFYEEIKGIPKGNFIELSYEELTSDRLKTLEKIYRKLSLPGFKQAKKHFISYIETITNYQKKTYTISLADKKRIYSHWHMTIDRWGYEKPIDSQSQIPSEDILSYSIQRLSLRCFLDSKKPSKSS